MTRIRWFHSLVLVLLVAVPFAATRAQSSMKLPGAASLEGAERAGNLTETSTSLKVSFSAGAEPKAVQIRRSGDLAIMQGDIVLGSYNALTSGNSKGGAISGPHMLWQYRDPANSKRVVIPYVFDSTLSAQGQASVKAAIADFQAKTCIRVAPRTDQPHYLKFIKGEGCYSYLGVADQGAQPISLGAGCETRGVALHQMMHALGFNHEQSRPDRDAYVTINFQNLQQEARQAFDIVTDPATQSLPYDYASIMHSAKSAFTANGKETLTPKKAGAQIGQRTGLSALDAQKINKLYQCQ